MLPCLTLVAVLYAQTLLVMRSSLLEEMGADYLTTARAKGLRDDVVRRRHAVPNALLPTVTLMFINLGMAGRLDPGRDGVLLAGPGRAVLPGADRARPPAGAGPVHGLRGAMIVMNLLADLLYPLLDPRVRTT